MNNPINSLELGQDVVTDFQKNGFTQLPSLVCDEDLDELRTVYDQILSGKVDTSHARDGYLGDLTRQLVGVEHCHPLFRENAALAAGRKIITQLFDWEPVFLYSQLLYKPPDHPHETPWHQDAAYTKMPYAQAGKHISPMTAQFWMALDDADEENGCMHFHPSVRELLPHYVVSGSEEDEARLLGLTHPEKHIDPSSVQACPIQAGCATVHTASTLHYTPANRSSRPRRAYIFNFAASSYIQQRKPEPAS